MRGGGKALFLLFHTIATELSILKCLRFAKFATFVELQA